MTQLVYQVCSAKYKVLFYFCFTSIVGFTVSDKQNK